MGLRRIRLSNSCFLCFYVIIFVFVLNNCLVLANNLNPSDSYFFHIEDGHHKYIVDHNCDSVLTVSGPTFSVYWEGTGDEWAVNRYRLLPFESEWSKWGKRNSQSYFKVPRGQYMFQIQHSNGRGIELMISVDSPFWTTKGTIFGLVTAGFLLVILMLIYLYRQKIEVAKRRVELKLKKEYLLKFKAGQEKSGELANTVKSQGRVRSRKYKKVTVLFADIQGFTRIVEHINPEHLIDELDRFVIHFDEIVEKYHIEKIKTIGDAYMCAGGLPNKNRTNPIEVVMAGLAMQRFMEESKSRHKGDYGFWELRIGIHTGPVISGEIGRKNVSFDIWGDTVNIASRMESSGTVGMINVTGVTYQLIKEFFVCDYRGKMPIKYKGETDMYYVRRLKPELSADESGVEPNKKFHTRLQHIRFGDLEEYVLNKLGEELLDELFYHSKAHTADVLTQIEIIARGEKVNEEDLLLLKTAALLHDVGFIFEYQDHEDNSISFAREILPKYNYEEYQIQQVAELIDVTKVGRTPGNFMEKIMKDADLDYLGRADFIPVSENLYRELNAHGKKMSLEEWNQMQYEFISNHTYYTATARTLRQVNKERQLQKLKELIQL